MYQVQLYRMCIIPCRNCVCSILREYLYDIYTMRVQLFLLYWKFLAYASVYIYICIAKMKAGVSNN